MTTILDFFYKVLTSFGQFWNWLSNPLPYLNIAPLELFTFTGLTIVLGILLVKFIL